MKAGFIVRMFYMEYGIKKGYYGWVRSKGELDEKMNRMRIPRDSVVELYIRRPQDEDLKPYDPSILNREGEKT